MINQILEGDSKEKLHIIESNSVDEIVTDPPYGYSFMNKDWDKSIVSIDVWKECLRVLKPGAFAFVMSAPRQDVLSHMIVNLTDAGFKTDFTSIYWAYASGFPKASNISKMVDKKLSVEPIKITPKDHTSPNFSEEQFTKQGSMMQTYTTSDRIQVYNTIPNSDQAKKLDGSYAGFQPKPAVEVILVCMKPLSEKNYTEQAMSNDKGVTWFDDCRIPFINNEDRDKSKIGFSNIFNGTHYNDGKTSKMERGDYIPDKGRFPANLICSDNALDIDDFSKYFDLDVWQAQFLIVEKASKSEKNVGLELNDTQKVNDGRTIPPDNAFQRGDTDRKNTHPTVKPVTLMSYLIMMGSREGDIILDPFCGSGTTLIASLLLKRNYIGIELNHEYVNIAQKRLNYWKNKRYEKIQKIKRRVERENVKPLEVFF